MEFVGLATAQHVQEMRTDGIVVGLGVDAQVVVAESVPVADDRRKQRQHAVGDLPLLAEIRLGFDVTEKGAAGTQHIHRVSRGGDALEHFLERLGQAAEPFQPGLVGIQLLARGKSSLEYQVRHFLECTARRQILDVVAPVGQAGTFLAHGRQGGLAGDLATQARAFEFLGSRHRGLQLPL